MIRRVLLVGVLFASVAVALESPAPVSAQGEGPPPCDSGRFDDVPGQGPSCTEADGTYRVRLRDGSHVRTHGPDRVPGTPASHIGGEIPENSNAPTCVSSGWRSEVIYAYPSNGTNNSASWISHFRSVVKAANAFLETEGTFSGSTATNMEYRFKCDSAGNVAVATSRLGTSTSGDSYSTIVNDLRANGFTRAQTTYWVFYDAAMSGYCGQAQIGHGDSLTEFSTSPLFAVAYRTANSCWTASVMMHEVGHNHGAVQLSAPNTTGAWHCKDEQDVMCYDDDGAGGVVTRCSTVQWDCQMNDYFDPAPTSGEYLYTHWNLAFCLNDYLDRNGCVGTPTGLTATASLAGPTFVDWTAPSLGGAPIRRYELEINGAIRNVGTASQYSHSCTALTSYTYRVRAVNAWEDTGPWSSSVTEQCGA